MAEKKKLTKGFGFYLFMFILMLIVVFMVIVTVMIFSPKKVILGYQYFTYGDEYEFVKPSDAEEKDEEFDFSTLSKIVVNCHSAKVNIIKSGTVEKDTIKIINRTSGFAKKSNNVDFKYSVTYAKTELDDVEVPDKSTLNISITEAESFLRFSNNVSINIILPIKSKYDFSKTEFNISTTSGNVTIGNEIDSKDYQSVMLDINKLFVNTKSGRIKITKTIKPEFDLLSMSTGSGFFTTELDEITIKSTPKFVTSKGNFTFKKLLCLEPLDLNMGDGKISVDEMEGSVRFAGHNAVVNLKSVNGYFSANETADLIDKSIINIDKITGDVSMPYAKRSNIKIKEVDGMLNIVTTSGSIEVGQKESPIAKASWLETASGKIVAHLGSNADAEHYFTSTTGSINATFETVPVKTFVKSQKGAVNVYVNSSYSFIMQLKNAKGEAYEKVDEHIDLTFVDSAQYTYPLNINNCTNQNNVLDIETDGEITADLITIIEE